MTAPSPAVINEMREKPSAAFFLLIFLSPIFPSHFFPFPGSKSPKCPVHQQSLGPCTLPQDIFTIALMDVQILIVRTSLHSTIVEQE